VKKDITELNDLQARRIPELEPAIARIEPWAVKATTEQMRAFPLNAQQDSSVITPLLLTTRL
jgi:hypothetical protein